MGSRVEKSHKKSLEVIIIKWSRVRDLIDGEWIMILVSYWITIERRDQQNHKESGEHPCDKNVHEILVVKIYNSRMYVKNCGSLAVD